MSEGNETLGRAKKRQILTQKYLRKVPQKEGFGTDRENAETVGCPGLSDIRGYIDTSHSYPLRLLATVLEKFENVHVLGTP